MICEALQELSGKEAGKVGSGPGPGAGPGEKGGADLHGHGNSHSFSHREETAGGSVLPAASGGDMELWPLTSSLQVLGGQTKSRSQKRNYKKEKSSSK